mmetsp:Transcript_28939/g.53233  ORF Transcript_28939/g.53233 Transcript_28939/m.53233 type:complete len:93 (-) Transcript_28939:2-280(-)
MKCVQAQLAKDAPYNTVTNWSATFWHGTYWEWLMFTDQSFNAVIAKSMCTPQLHHLRYWMVIEACQAVDHIQSWHSQGRQSIIARRIDYERR